MSSTEVTVIESYDLARANQTLELADDLAKFIKDNKLTTNVQGKDFVNVEGWQFAGSRLGIVPMVDYLTDMSTPEEIKYECKVSLYDLQRDKIVGVGIARCSNKESGKKFFADYAVGSMCQTRAIGKAYRNLLGWIIKAAGYEPTTAEEMDFAKPVTLGSAIDELEAAKDRAELVAVWNRHKKQFGTHTVFAHAKEMRKAALCPAPAASPTAPHLATTAQLELLDNLLKSSSVADIAEQLREKMQEPDFTKEEASRMIEEVNSRVQSTQQAQRF
ncbi:hypothetical protein DNI29_19045 [Hymenobacter sediminis]|uniref:hypothetical protein n=1 Tax=Hymenobacter sediminis TaxID=2218621 RepID=UPI000DA65601|nr:hypothetical protein [Hymenobacter sediminis]RPD45479.1 hypothetical protein DNI29_19045 [Hymenobacter sediminis]